MKKTSSYKKEDKKKTGRANKYKKPSRDKSLTYPDKEVTYPTKASGKDESVTRPVNKKNKKEELVKDKTSFDPYYNKQSRKYKITCFVCKKEKMVAVEPIEGVPVICDDCLVELEARKLLDQGGAQKTKKLNCKWCGKSFYALNESYLFCDECYDHFSHTIKARGRGFVSYKCKNCGADGWIHPKVLAEKKKENDMPLCRACMKEEEQKAKKEKSKSRINKVKNRKNTLSTSNNPKDK